MPDTCQICRSAPAARITIRRHVGLLVLMRSRRVQLTLCREHGDEIVGDWTRKTLVQGWWGIFSIPVNVYALATNIGASRELRRLPHAHLVAPERRVANSGFEIERRAS